jgi:acetyltransferase
MGIVSEYGNFLKSYHAKANFFLKWGVETRTYGTHIIQKAIDENRNVLTELEAKKLLRIHGMPVMKDYLVQTEDEAVETAKKIGADVALKIVSPDILHKTDIGGVKLNIGTTTAVRKTFHEIISNVRKHKPDADIKGILISPMAEKGIEVIVGTKVDDQFGPVILFGMGGIMVEAMKDFSTRVLPITNLSAKRMIDDIKMSPILKGTRGTPPCDLKSLRELLKKVSSLIESYPEIHEMDLNPIIVHERGVTIVDARIILGPALSNNSNY